MLLKPEKLKKGDKVATISPSSGLAGEKAIRPRYEQGVRRLEEIFGLEVIPMPNSLKGIDYLSNHPEARAEDFMTAFRDDSIKGIIANIGGDDSIRLLPYIDFDVVRKHPKIVMGYSDVTISHLFCHHAGLSSFYGPAILTDFAENVEMPSYTIDMVKRTLFSDEVLGTIEPAKEWTSDMLEWTDPANQNIRRTFTSHTGNELLQGIGKVKGRLIGGCIEVLEFAKGTVLWPKETHWDDAILFFETSEEKTKPEMIMRWLRNYAAQGILHQANGIVFAKPKDETYYDEYKDVIRTVMVECGLTDLPVLYNMNFGHTEPKFILPYGAMAEIDCDTQSFAILESGVS